ncbi:hypothetical protein AALA22_13005 [Anaerovoracaceae bacterium 41-7]
MRRYTVAIDLDGVIWDLVTPWLAKYNEITGEHVDISDIKSYKIGDYVEHEGILNYILEVNNFWNEVKLYDDALTAIEKLKSCPELDLVICTSTSYKIAQQKISKLLELVPILDEKDIVLTSRKELLDVHFMIDDYENNLKRMANGNKGVAILIDRPYNKSFPNSTYGILRKGSLLETADSIIDYIEGQKEMIRKFS